MNRRYSELVAGAFLLILLLCCSFTVLDVDAELLLGEEFGNLNNWTVVKGSWIVSNGILKGTTPDNAEGLIWAGDTSGIDYQATANVRIADPNGEACIIVRYLDSANYYWVGLGCWNHKYSIGKVVDGIYSELASAGLSSELQIGKWYNTTVVAVGNSLEIYVDGSKVLEAHDSSHPNGAVGFRTYDGTMQAKPLVVHSLEALPATPSLIGPSNNKQVKIDHYTYVSFSWSSVSSATDYQIAYYGPDLGNESSPIILNTNRTNIAIDHTFHAGSEYYKYFWKVRSHNSVGYSPWSDTWSFTTYSYLVLATPNLISPSNGSNVEVSHYGFATLCWGNVSSAKDYQVAYYGNSYGTEDSPTITTWTTNSFTGVNFAPPGPYFWKVRVHNGYGVGPWSDTWSFTTYMTPPVQATSPTFTPLGGTYSSTQSVTISCPTSSVTIRYTLDGSEPTSSSTIYSDPILVSTNMTIKAKVFSFVQPNSNISSATYTINLPKVNAPTFNPLGGAYNSTQNVVLTCTTSGATIRYTLDGSEPNTLSTMYSGPISVASNCTIKAKAFKTDMSDSDTALATYTINIPADMVVDPSTIFSSLSDIGSKDNTRTLYVVTLAVVVMAVTGILLYYKKRNP